jgi:uncharacterized protein YbcI
VDDSESATDHKSRATAISNGIGALHREHYGRGADRIRTLIYQDVVMTRLEDCFTTVEKKMIAEGAFLQVRETRWRRSSRRSRTTPTWRLRSFSWIRQDRARVMASRVVEPGRRV